MKMKIKRDKWGRFMKGFHPKTEFKKGQHTSPSTEFKKEQKPWNKNLKGWNAGEKNSMYGRENKWGNHTEKSIKKMSKAKKGKHFSPETEFKKGHKVSKKIRRKIGEANKEHIVTEKTRKKVSMKIKDLWKDEAYRKNYIERRANQVFPVKDSLIEVKIQNFLKKLGIEFFTHQYMKIKHGYQCDILIPAMNLVIECDGNYWHKYPVGLEKDHIRTKELIEKGFKVLRLWEFEINEMSIDNFKNKLEEA